MIDSLQEQVSNAKDKLLRLMSASQSCEDQNMDSSATNLNSSSTQTTELQSDGPSSSSLPQRVAKSQLSPPHLTAAAVCTTPRHAAVGASRRSELLKPQDGFLPAPSRCVCG